MSLLDNNYDFDAMESMIDFKVHWHDPINHGWGRCDTTSFNLPKDVIYRNGSTLLKLDISLIDKKVLREYIAKLKEYYSIFSNRVLEDGDNPFYNYFEFYEIKVQFSKDTIFKTIFKDTIFIYTITDSHTLNHHPMFDLENGRMTIKGALENDIFYNVLCEIEKRLD